MAAEETLRLGIWRWTDDGDDFTRAQMDGSHENLELRVATFSADTVFPSGPAGQFAKSFHLDTGANIIYFSYNNGASWQALNDHAAPTSTLTPGDSNSEGVAVSTARSDHSHALPGWGTTTSAIGTTAAAGSNSTFARSDHVHVIGSGAINSSTQFANGVVSNASLATGAVTTAKIGDSQVTGAKLEASQRIPVGVIMPYGGSSAPTGWALCDGSSKSKTDPDFAALFAVIGENFGGGGANFNLPNLTNRVPQGVGTTVLGGNGGGTATLVASNLPAHTHGPGTLTTSAVPSHTHDTQVFVLEPSGTANPPSHTHEHTVPAHGHGFPNGRAIPYSLPGSPFKLQYTSGAGYEFGQDFWDATDAEAGGGTYTTKTSGTADEIGNHSHGVSVVNGAGGSHSHNVTAGQTASTGSGSAFNVNTAHVGVNYIIKL